MAMRSFFLLTLLAILLLHRADSADNRSTTSVCIRNELPGIRANMAGKGPTMSVRIRNELPGFLTVHCKSGDDDIGQRHLSSWGTPYYFAFNANIWGTTVFWCRFTYGAILWNSFEVWRGSGFLGHKKLHCRHCLWAVRTDAFYRAEDGTSSPLIAAYPWRSDPHPAMLSDSEARNVSELHH